MILITGASGQVGLALVNHLVAAHVPVRTLAHSAQSAERLAQLGAEVVSGDLDDAQDLGRALDGVTRLFLLSPSGPSQVERESRVIDAAARAGVQHLVKLSVLGAGEDDGSVILRWHAEIEAHLRNSQLASTVMRPAIFQQNITAFYAESAKTAGAIFAPLADAKLNYIDVRDIAAVAAQALTQDGHAGQTYALTGPAALSQAELAAQIARVAGRDVNYVAVSEADTRAGMLASGLPEWYADALLGLYAYYRRGGGERVTSEVQDITGQAARTVEGYLAEHAPAFRSDLTPAP